MTSEMAPNSGQRTAEVPVLLDPLPPADVLAGRPEAGATVLGALGGLEVGVWEMTPGTCRDVEADEYFVVVSGRATVDVDGAATLHLGPGDVVRLAAGAATVWTVHETLRKVYVTPSV